MKRAVLPALAAAALLAAPAVHAGPILDRAAQALESDPVYVDPQAQPSLTPAEKAKLEQEIADRADGPTYVAVLPAAARAEAGGDAGEALNELAHAVDRRGVYAVVAGGQFRAGATGDTGLDRGEAPELATKAFQAHHDDGLGATLVDFVDRVGDARESGGSGGGGGGFPWWIVIVAGAGALILVVRRRRRAAAQQAAFAEVKEAAREDLVALASDVQELEDDVEANPRAKEAYLAALDQYGHASGAFDRARTSRQLEPVAQALEEGRYEMAVAKAALAGEPAPERRPPCFFDPRHGPSVRDVEWSPPFGGPARAVPACAACALRVEEGDEPESRQVLAGGRAVPYWSAGPAYGSYYGGFFPGLVLGEMLGGGFGGWGGPVVVGDGGDFGGGFDAGDFGGGGGGDFGGGDFGGGDSGGGGGDF